MSRGDPIIDLQTGWKKVKEDGIVPFLKMIENKKSDKDAPRPKLRDMALLYDYVFTMCKQREPYNWSVDMYDNYSKSVKEHLETVAVPALALAKQTSSHAFLIEWRKRWKNEELIVTGLWHFFQYLDRCDSPLSVF